MQYSMISAFSIEELVFLLDSLAPDGWEPIGSPVYAPGAEKYPSQWFSITRRPRPAAEIT